MDFNIGKIYEASLDKEVRKALGQYYTPDYIVKYIIKRTLGNIDIVDKPFIKIIDISCGVGYFLLAAYDLLREKFLDSIDVLKSTYGNTVYILEKDGERKEVLGKDYWIEDNIHYHILKNCIYGADKDRLAVEITKAMLISKCETDYIDDLNIINCDSLVRWENRLVSGEDEEKLREFWSNKFDIVVGNPPYIGHKQLDMAYKKWLLEEYEDVFKDKSDISYCFFKRILEILSPKGVAGIITSRYFMESPTGIQLRQYLTDKANILEIVDFYGAEIFKAVGVATAIYIFSKEKLGENEIRVNKLIDDNYKFSDSDNLEDLVKTNLFEEFTIKQKDLDLERWILVSKEKQNIYNKIEGKAEYRLRDIAISFQGVITGCDKAFVLTKEDIAEYNIEWDLIKKWIKNSDIGKYTLNDSSLYLIYADSIEDEEDYANSISYIERYRNRLENRRECKKGIRKWYQLQWGRKSSLFQQAKIIFPFKSSENRFALDLDHSYFSADVYALIIKDEFQDRISLEYLLGLLNSSLYEFYFKLFGKKMGKGMYDYYPNSILNLKIITGGIMEEVTHKVEKILELKKEKNQDQIDERIMVLKKDIDEILYGYLDLTREEMDIIYRTINPSYRL